jgi:translation initiation factor 1A
MVKNTQGGSSHKKFGRKFTTAKPNNRLRVSQDEAEIYAIVTKMLGNNMFHCFCIDDINRLGHIRGKFCGRGKRENKISPGTWVLIGIREWDMDKISDTSKDKKKKLQQCDLLEVYSDTDKDRLKDTVAEDWSKLITNDVSKIQEEQVDENAFQFATDRDIERDRLIEEMNSATGTRVTLHVEDEEEVNIDDI